MPPSESISGPRSAKMKWLVLLFLVGVAQSASLYDTSDVAVDEFHDNFLEGIEQLFADDTDDDVKTELGKKLREHLDEILEKIKEAVDNGKTVREDLQKKLQEIKEKMKDLKVDLGEKAKELIEKIKEKTKEFWKNLFDKLGIKDKRSLEEDAAIEEVFHSFSFKEYFRKLKDAILDTVDKQKLIEKVEKIFGKGNEMADSLLEYINKNGDKAKQKLLDLIDRYLGKEEKRSVQARSIKEYWEKIKDYFKDLHIDLKEKYMKFGEWVKNVVDKGMTKGKDKMSNIKAIAKEFIDHAKGVSKEVAVEALEFLRPYKEDLGSLYDQVKETVKDILNKKEE